MAVFKTANGKGKYHDTESKKQVINYILNPKKMSHGYFGVFHVDPNNIVESMNEVSRYFGKSDGVQLRHFILSFEHGEVRSIETVHEIAMRISCRLGEEYQIVYAVHDTQSAPHFHFVMNSVSYVDGHRYYGTKKDHYDMMKVIRDVLREYHIWELKYVSND